MNRRNVGRLGVRFSLAILPLAAMLATQAFAAGGPSASQLPTNGRVVAGQAALRSQGSTLTVTQASQRAVIDWQRFDLGAQARIVFDQAAGRNAATLNRVTGGNASLILGRIDAPGQVFITNPAGIIFGAGASINVGGLVASSLTLDPGDFMAGRMNLTQGSRGGTVLNAGTLTAADGGFVALLAPEVRNEGVVAARAGAVVMAGGEAIELAFADAGLANVRVSPAQIRTLVENRNAVLAPDGWVLLSARSAQALQAGVVNQNGVINATSLVSKGGRILLEGDTLNLGASSRLDASGALGGGSVLVGGDWQGSGNTLQSARQITMADGASIHADASQSGSGGTIVLWSRSADHRSRTRAEGLLSATGPQGGGRIETSGDEVQLGGLRVNAGRGGLWLTDPTDLSIDASLANSYAATLNGGSNVTVQTSGGGAQNGDLTVNAPISWSTPATLDLQAHGNILIKDTISTDQGSLALRYGLAHPNAGNTARYEVMAPLTLPAGAHFFTQLGSNGSRGALASIEWQFNLARQGHADTTLALFADAATLQQLKSANFTGAPENNHMSLAGAGVWAEWRPRPEAALRLSIAQPIGARPNASAQGRNQDGSRIGTRVWASAQWNF